MPRLRILAALALATLGGLSAFAASSCATARAREASPPSTGESRTTAAQPLTTAASNQREVLRLDFDRVPVGPFTEALLRGAAPEAHSISSHLAERSHVVQDADGNHVLEIGYPARSVGPAEGGAVFIVKVPAGDDYYLSYRVRFDAGFDWVKGGKLPGLSSAGGKYTGGKIPVDGDGWSARLVWKSGGGAAVYFYHVGMEGPWGDTLHLATGFQPGRWHAIVQHVRLNHGDRADGLLEVFVDGESKLERRDLKFRLGDKGRIDSLCFSTFHGGNNPTFAPSRDGAASFDDFVIRASPPPELAARRAATGEP